MIQLLEKSEDEFELLINGKTIDNTNISSRIDKNSGMKFFEIYIKHSEIFNELGQFSLDNFPPLYFITFPIDIAWLNNGVYPSIWFMSEDTFELNKDKSFEVSLDFHTDLYDWHGNYTFTQYFNELKKIADNSGNLEVVMHDKKGGLEYGFLIQQIDKISGTSNISKVLVAFLELIKALHLEVEQNLVSNNYQNLVGISFNFPDKLKVSCEQYLLYFATFLSDLGINATSNLKEEAGKVLFSVTPTDEIEALDKIREALTIYLNLPSSPIVYDESFAAMRLQQQIENLQHSQRMAVRELQFNEKLLIAQSDTIREKNITISQQQSVIEQQNKILEKISSTSIMMNSVENKEELQEIYDGLKIGESEFLKKQLGIHLNPAKVIKTAVKNTFGKGGEKKSVLGLDEES